MCVCNCNGIRDRQVRAGIEEHIDFLETQLSLVKSLGEQNYLQSALGELQGGDGH